MKWDERDEEGGGGVGELKEGRKVDDGRRGRSWGWGGDEIVARQMTHKG